MCFLNALKMLLSWLFLFTNLFASWFLIGRLIEEIYTGLWGALGINELLASEIL